MTIDVKKLERLLDWARSFEPDETQNVTVSGAEFRLFREAASACAATLPREVVCETWGIADETGKLRPYIVESKEAADNIAAENDDWRSVRLTGTAVIQGER